MICSSEPTNYTEATATYALADVVIDSSDFTLANGDASGRKVTVAAQTGILIDTTGTAAHIALCTGTVLLYVTTCANQAIVANGSNVANTAAFDIEIADPT